MKPILTIGIPAYNRVQKLKICLRCIEKQRSLNNVEILVSDDCSTDGTGIFVKEFIKSHNLNIRYTRNKNNLGFDRNILNIYKKARGKYVWFFSDDDEMMPKALEQVVAILKENSPSVLYPNQIDDFGNIVVGDGDFIDIVKHMPTGIGIHVSVNKKFYLPDDISRLTIVRLMSFISCCLVIRDKTIIKNLSRFIGSSILQDAITSLCLIKKPYAYITKSPMVRGKKKEYFSEWFMESTLFGVGKLYNDSILRYPKNLARKVALHNALFALLVIAEKKRLNVPVQYKFNLNLIKRLIRVYKYSFIYLTPMLFLASIGDLLPASLINFSYGNLRRFAKTFKYTQ